MESPEQSQTENELEVQHLRVNVPMTTGTTCITLDKNLVIIGANGSGKTRLGVLIDECEPRRVHRLSAQKSLRMPNECKMQDTLLNYKMKLRFGHTNPEAKKTATRWYGDPAISELNDFEHLVNVLICEHVIKSTEYVSALHSSLTGEAEIERPTTTLVQTQKIWERLLPNRVLHLGSTEIRASLRDKSNQQYLPSQLSDGERVLFYLIGQCLLAPENGVIVIDEPELHLHKSIQDRLWNEIESCRPDCCFVYLTHNIDFATTRTDARKLWIKEYDGEQWDFEQIDEIEGIPEELLLEILGSRNPVLFVEGTAESYDTALYKLLFDNFLVIPRGSCHAVIQSTKALNANRDLTHLYAYGLIDRDRLSTPEIAANERNGVYTLEVAEVENLFCTPEIIQFVCLNQNHDFDELMGKISGFIFNELEKELEVQIRERVTKEVEFQLKTFNPQIKSEADIASQLESLFEKINSAEIYGTIETKFNEIIEQKDFEELLRFYNRKSLAGSIGQFFEFNNKGLQSLILRKAKSGDLNTIKKCLKKYFGNFRQFMEN